MNFFGILFIFALAGAIWFIFDSMRAREIATELARNYCEKRGVQFLDGSAALRSMRMVRRSDVMKVQRKFHFEYTVVGESRDQGVIVITGRTVDHFLLK